MSSIPQHVKFSKGADFGFRGLLLEDFVQESSASKSTQGVALI